MSTFVVSRLASRHIHRLPASISHLQSFTGRSSSSSSSAVCAAASANHSHSESPQWAWTLLGVAALGAIPVIELNRNDATNYASCSANPALNRGDVTITRVEAELIARKLRGIIDIPGIPNIIEKPVVEQAILAFIEVCPLVLPEGVFNRLIAGEAGANGVSEAIIRQINDSIYIPVLSREAQNAVVEQLCSALFSPNNNFETVRRQMVARALQEVFNADSRIVLATKLNENVDIPLLSEDKEQAIAEKLVNVCFDLLEAFVPATIRDLLQNTSPEEIQEVRNSMVTRLADKIDIPFTSEDQEEKALRYIVDFFLAFYGLEEGTKNPEEQFAAVDHELKCVELELEAFQEISAEKIKKMKDQRASLKKKKNAIVKTLNGRTWLGALKFW